MKKILVPVDFSEHSEYALEVAASLAKTFDAEIVVLHMMGLSESIVNENEAEEFAEVKYYMRLAKKRFDLFLNRPWLKGVKIQLMIQNYKIFSEINTISKEKDIDLIIMGSHGAGGISEIFVGSNTEKVVRSSEVPVLVIKKRTKNFRVKKVAFGFDFEAKSLSAFKNLKKLCAVLNAELCLLYVNLPGIRFMSTAQMQAKTNEFLNLAFQGQDDHQKEVSYYCDYSIEKGIYNFAKDAHADVIAVTTHGRSGLAHFFKGSIGEDVANHVDLPVLITRI
jgi:nucleotide-binding universal stress UspA family protein